MAMSRWRASWLYWRTINVRAGAGRARARLLAAGDRGDQHAVDSLWNLWFARPDDGLLAKLIGWGRPRWDGSALDFSLIVLRDERADRQYLLSLAQRFEHPLHDIARQYIADSADTVLVDDFCREVIHADSADPRLERFCAANRLTPSDPELRAGFLFLTGQRERYEAEDPDGRLLVAFYPSGSHPVSTRIRTRLLASPELPATRLLTAPDSGNLAMDDEVAHMAHGLLEKGYGSEPWALLVDQRIEDLLRALPDFPPAWQPDDPADRALFTRLRELTDDGDVPSVAQLAYEAEWTSDRPPVWLTLVDRPMALLTREQLDLARTELARPDLPAQVCRLLEPLEACLTRRLDTPT
jgi:hypothetical protein